METVISTVVALCMFVAGELKEHRIQDKMSDCLKGKRENIDGSKSIKKIVSKQ